MIKIFNVSRTNELTIDLAVVKSIPEFKKIVTRDKGSSGDSDGRKKYRADKEMIYVYYLADLRSPPRLDGKSERDIHDYAVTSAGLEESYQVDEVIEIAIAKYKEIQLDTPELRLLNSLLRGLVMSSKVVDVITDKIETDLDFYANGGLATTAETLADLESDSVELKPDASAMLSNLIGNMNEISKMGSSVNKAITTVKDVYEKVKQQMSEDDAIRGGGTINPREMPN